MVEKKIQTFHHTVEYFGFGKYGQKEISQSFFPGHGQELIRISTRVFVHIQFVVDTFFLYYVIQSLTINKKLGIKLKAQHVHSQFSLYDLQSLLLYVCPLFAFSLQFFKFSLSHLTLIIVLRHSSSSLIPLFL